MIEQSVLLRTGLVIACGGLVSLVAGSSQGAPVAETLQIGTTPSGRAVEVVAVGEPGEDSFGRARDERPALLVVAGLQGHHAVGIATAQGLAERLMQEHAASLAGRTLYVISAANPDGIGRWNDGSFARAEWGRAPLVMDFDGDGRTSEDGADDLNGDGFITLMRVRVEGTDLGSRYGIRATHIIDPDDDRLMREPVAKDGERAEYALIAEGIDNDGDGSFNEDGWGGDSVYGGGGGVDFDKHWPTMWPEHTDGAGRYPLERSTARAITEWTQSRSNIVGVVVYGVHDTLSKVPASGKYGPVGEVPTGIEKGDEHAYGAVSEVFKEATGITKPESDVDRSGSFLQWAYSDLGVYAFGTPVWVRPDLVKAVSEDVEEGEAEEEEVFDAQAAAMALAVERDRASLAERGVPPNLVEFIYMSPDERAAEMLAMELAGPESLAEIMQTIRELPMDVQQRLMALGQGNADPLPPEVTAEDREAVGADGTPGGSKAKRKSGSSADAKWLAWMEDAGVDGFVEWSAFEHPQLGSVEIGGFVPGARVNPPDEMMDGLIDQQAVFVAGLMSMLPDLKVGEPVVERVSDDLWRISLEARNNARLATMPAIGEKARRLPGLIMMIDPELALDHDAIVSGARVVRAGSVGGFGDVARGEWLIVGAAGDVVRVELRSPRFGDRMFDVRLGDGGGR